MTHGLLVLICSLLMLFGLAGVLVPALPGIPFMAAVALIFAWADHFQHLGAGELAFLLSLALLSVVVDYAAGTLGARWGGASAKATGAGLAGMVVGMLVLPPWGGFLGLFLGVLVTELVSGNLRQAIRAAGASLVGSLVGIVINLVIGLIFLAAFVLMALH